MECASTLEPAQLRGATELAHAFAAARDGEMNAFMQLPGSRTASKRGVFYNMTASSLQDDSGIPMNRHEAPTSSGSTEATVRVPTLAEIVSKLAVVALFLNVAYHIHWEGALVLLRILQLLAGKGSFRACLHVDVVQVGT